MTSAATLTHRSGSTRATLANGVAMVAVTFGLARYGYGLLLPQMHTALGLSAGTAGLISSAAYVSYMVANVAVVSIVNRRGPRTAVAIAAITAAVGMALIAGAQDTLLLAAGVLVGGAAAGFAFPPYADLVATRVAAERRDVVWAAISSGTGWGVALAGPIAIAAGNRWRLAWLAFVLITVVVAIPAVRNAASRSTGRARRRQLNWTWFFCPKSRPLLVSSVLLGIGSSVWWAFCVAALEDAGVSATAAKVVYAVCGAASVAASFSRVVFARIGLRRGYLLSCITLAAALAVLAVTTHTVGGALAAAVLFGVFYCAVIAAGGIWSARVFADHPAAGLAAFGVALTIGTLIGPTAAGALIEHAGYPTTLMASAAVVLLALPFCPPTARRQAELAEHVCQATPVRD